MYRMRMTGLSFSVAFAILFIYKATKDPTLTSLKLFLTILPKRRHPPPYDLHFTLFLIYFVSLYIAIIMQYNLLAYTNKIDRHHNQLPNKFTRRVTPPERSGGGTCLVSFDGKVRQAAGAKLSLFQT